MKLIDLQTMLDIQKWHLSEDNAMDMCAHLEYCPYCRINEEFPCAKAYNRMEKAKKEAAAAGIKI